MNLLTAKKGPTLRNYHLLV